MTQLRSFSTLSLTWTLPDSQPLWPRGEKCAVRPKKKIDTWLHRIQKSIEFAVRIYLLLRGGPGG